jgi:hypothetical protein
VPDPDAAMPFVSRRFRLFAVLCLFAAALLWQGTSAAFPPARDRLPRFTEEREAAALLFVRKNLPEVLPLLAELKKSHREQYEQQVREVFAVSEALADLQQDDPRRYELELKIWKTENRAAALAAKLHSASEPERHKAEAALLDLARELVDLDLHVLQLKTEQLEKELNHVKEQRLRLRRDSEKEIRARFEELVKQGQKGRN